MQPHNGDLEPSMALRPYGAFYPERTPVLHPETDDWGSPAEPAGWQRHWKVVRGHKLWLALFCLLGTAGGFAVFVPRPPTYSAATTLELQPINQSFMNIGAADPMTGLYSETGLNAQTQIAIIKSASIIGPAIDRLQRESSAVVAAPADPLSQVRSRLGIVPKEPLEAFTEGLARANKTLSVRVLPGTRIIEISCDSTVPEVAANFVNALASEYLYQNLQSRSTNSQRTSQWLQGELEETKARLEQAESRLQEFSRKSGNLFVSEPETLSGTRLKELQGNLAAAQTDRINKQALYQASLTRPIETFPEALSGTLAQQQADIDKKRAELAQLSATLTPNHYRVQRVQAELDQLVAQQQRDRNNILLRIKSDYEEAVNREKMLAGAYRAQAGEVSSEADKAAEYGSLKREVEILQGQLNSLLQQSNQTSVASAFALQTARVVDGAKPAGKPSGPSLPRHLAIGFALGGLLGYASSMLRDGRKQRRQQERFGLPGYASRVLQVPELGVIPTVAMNNGKPVRLFSRSKHPVAPVVADGHANGSGHGHGRKRVELITWTEKPSLFAESFRLTLASLTTGKSGASPTVLVVASPGPAEGKTTVATNIAIARAETNRTVLLLETDLRKPRLADLFGLSNPRGWSDLILEDGSFQADQIASRVQPTHIPGLYAMAGGTSPTELIHQIFNSPKVPLLLAALRRQFDMVIIDTPPLLQFSEARLIGRLADGVILVLRSDHTNRGAALACRQRLWEDGIPILGTVLNDWNPNLNKDQRYGAYYDSHYSYYSAKPE
jgi:polysaccharide biosynthesis transport protein